MCFGAGRPACRSVKRPAQDSLIGGGHMRFMSICELAQGALLPASRFTAPVGISQFRACRMLRAAWRVLGRHEKDVNAMLNPF